MKLIVDMNLSPAWIAVLQVAGHEALHWSVVGDPRAQDSEVMTWARRNGFVVFTHDLDFGALLAVTGAEGPSVIQLRATDVTPDTQGKLLLAALEQFMEQVKSGALISIDTVHSRVRLLPLR